MEKKGIYIHIPFCRSKCPYCDFYSLHSEVGGYDDYTMCVLESMEDWARKEKICADTLYFGGGTPSVIGAENLSMITKRAKELFGINGEITVECNPSAVEDGFFEDIAKSGVNRISLGMQSAVDSERRKLGRLSDTDTVSKRIAQAKSAGINNISLDVMLGVPEQTEKSLQETIDFCLDADVTHISAYMLSLEEGTYYYNNKERLNLPDEDSTVSMYNQLADSLEKNGYKHYEISNFARQGFESKHNLKYWNCEEYLGIGPSAHSFINGKRFYYPRDIKYFCDGKEPVFDCDGGDENEYIMLRLRLSDGIIFDEYEKRFGKKIPQNMIELAKKFADDGYMRIDENSMGFTRSGFLISNTLIAELENEKSAGN